MSRVAAFILVVLVTWIGWAAVRAEAPRGPSVVVVGPEPGAATGPAGGPTTAPVAANSLRPAPLPVKVVSASAKGPTAPKPTTATDQASCATAECHGNVKAYKVVHGPVNVNSCDACHKPVDVTKHTFEMRREKKDLCTFCHETVKPTEPVVHKPVMEGDCMGCHNPHGGETKKFVHGTAMADLCNRCHQNVMEHKKYVHGPAAGGACDSCHASHASKYPKLVNAQGTELCYSCHDQMKGQMASAKFTHKAATEKGCLECHDVHASNYAMQTKKPPLELCTGCHEHEKVKNNVELAKHKHSIVTKDHACLNCHTPHGGELAQLMKKEPIQVCMTCHDKEQKADGGKRVVMAVADVLDPEKVKHGPIREGNCGGCHSVHGSDEPHLLAKPYSEGFYQAFSMDKYELCFSCHESQVLQSPKAKGLTNFRNGDTNLHYAHVVKDEKGRNCRACHSTHASNHELHVRETVKYGKWEMPINFKKSGTGGSCSPGCHKPYEYDRETPVKYEPVRPATAKPVEAAVKPGAKPDPAKGGSSAPGQAPAKSSPTPSPAPKPSPTPTPAPRSVVPGQKAMAPPAGAANPEGRGGVVR